MTVAMRTERIVGVQEPRVAPPHPAKSKLKDLEREAAECGIKFIPAQRTAARYLMATAPGGGWLYPEVAIIESRRNGKTELLVPRIRYDLRAGRAILHTAQNRTLPRRVFIRVAQALPPGEVRSIRYANGQEQIIMRNGGEYLIVAPQRGARGLGADTLIFDELREFEDDTILAAASPTLASSSDPQTIYLSNAGSHRSVILNDLKRRGEAGEEGLAYLEWSASPERSSDDREGWAEANPALGHFLRMESLETAYRTLSPQTFETEHLCRWVDSMLPSVVSEAAWSECITDVDDKPSRPAIAFNMHPTGSRASAAMAWLRTDGRIALVELIEATGDPIDALALAEDIQALAKTHGAKKSAYASWTDKDLARNVRGSEALDGKEFAAASEFFARSVMQGRLAVDAKARDISGDVKWSARKPHDSGSWIVTPADPERPITGMLAAVRAVWLASQPRNTPRIG